MGTLEIMPENLKSKFLFQVFRESGISRFQEKMDCISKLQFDTHVWNRFCNQNRVHEGLLLTEKQLGRGVPVLGMEFGVENVSKALFPCGSVEGSMEGVIVLLTLECGMCRYLSHGSLLEVDEGDLRVRHE